MSSYYDLLGVAVSSSPEEIRKAYRKKAKQLHPDVNKAPDAQQMFQMLQKAYETLSDTNKRFFYDNKLKGTAEQQQYNYNKYAKFYQQSYYNDWVRVQKERKAQEAQKKHQEFLNNRLKFRESSYYYPFYILLYMATFICYVFGLGVLAVCAFIIFETHYIFIFFLSPFICGGIYFIKCTGIWYKEALKYF